MQDNERITFRDDLDGLDDDESLVEDPAVRRAKTLRFLAVFLPVCAFIVVLLVFFQPEGVVMTTSWPNGYTKTRATYVSADNAERRELHGAYTAWHETGHKASQGKYEHGQQVGEWRYWNEDGTLDTRR